MDINQNQIKFLFDQIIDMYQIKHTKTAVKIKSNQDLILFFDLIDLTHTYFNLFDTNIKLINEVENLIDQFDIHIKWKKEKSKKYIKSDQNHV